MHIKLSRFTAATLLGIWLNGCAILDNMTKDYNPQTTISAVKLPAAWQAPLPHDGSIRNLNEFWQRYPQPVLLDFIIQAQAHAANVATAVANIAEARENRIKAQATLLPKVDGKLSATRSLDQPENITVKGGGGFGINNSISNSVQSNLSATWEIDLLGSQRANRNATIAQEKAAEAKWHEARVSVAAEVATSYFNFVLCRQQSELQEQVQFSSEISSNLTNVAYQVGFKDAGELALAISNFADAKQEAKNQAAQCEVEVKNLTALTNYDETTVRQKLAEAHNSTPQLDLNSLFIIEEIPANAIRQRPDVYRAEVDLIRSAANVKQAAADRLPKVSLDGSIGWMRNSNAFFESKGRVWSLGPIQLTLPIFDGGALKATQATAEARYQEAATAYRGAVQKAIKETETALVNLHTTGDRELDMVDSLERLSAHLKFAEAKQKAGFVSKLEVEESRRNLLQAQKNAMSLQLERANAWLNLYRAAGGGWQSGAVDTINISGLSTDNKLGID